MSAPRVSVVVLAWNRWDLTRRCIESLARTTRPEDAEVILVDNGSTDGTLDAGRDFPWLRVLRLPDNLGYVRGNNAGIAATDPDSDVVLLNNDVVVEDSMWLEKLARAARRDGRTGIAAPRLVLADGRLIHAGTYIVPETCWGQTLGREESDVGQYPGLREVQGVVFAVVYICRETLRALGPLPEEYVSFFEDTDYSLQAREAGFLVVCTGELTLLHETGATLSDRPEERLALFERSRFVFRSRWRERLEAAYDLDLVAYTTVADRREFGTALLDLLIELDSIGVRVVHRDRDGSAEIGFFEGPWGRGHFARVFAERAIAPGSAVVTFDSSDRGGKGVVVAHVPIPTTHFHPNARSVARRDGQILLLARLRADEPGQGHLLLSALWHASRAGSPLRLVVLADPEMDGSDLLSLLATHSASSGLSAVVRDPFRAHDVCCLLASADGFVSWQTDRRGASERWLALACGKPVLFVGEREPEDGSARFLLSPSAAEGPSRLSRLQRALQWFASLSPEVRIPCREELRTAVGARSVPYLAAAIRTEALALSDRTRFA